MADKLLSYTSKVFTLLNDNVWRTLFLLDVPANQRINLLLFGLHPQGTVNTSKHVLMRLIRCTAIGSAASETDKSSSIAVQNGVPESPLVKVYEATSVNGGFGTDPTREAGPIRRMAFHPQQPADLPTLSRTHWQVPGGGAVALEYNNDGGASSLPAAAELSWEE